MRGERGRGAGANPGDRRVARTRDGSRIASDARSASRRQEVRVCGRIGLGVHRLRSRTTLKSVRETGIGAARLTSVSAVELESFLSGVRRLGYDRALGQSQAAEAHLREARKEMAALLLPRGYVVRVSGAAPNLPAVPWLAILDPDVTSSAQSGLYVVYLFDVTLSHVFLTMNQGVTAIRNRVKSSHLVGARIDDAAVAILESESKDIRNMMPAALTKGLLDSIQLGSTGFLPRAYEAGTISARAYELSSLPAEDVLRSDLSRFLTIYDAAVEARQRLTLVNPGRFGTPVLSEVPGGTEVPGIFRPKDAGEYIAQVTAHTERRSRRHEAVVESYGKYAMSLGWSAATNVHPRDLVLRRAGVEYLCEVKTVKANAEFAVREAIGQLFSYRYFWYPNAKPTGLVAIFSNEIGQAFVNLLDELGIISVWSGIGNRWSGSNSAKSIGLV